MTKCATCAGTYATVLIDGTRYFHACPPLSDAEVIAANALNTDRSKWSAADAATFAAASRVRPNARNENAPAPATLAPQVAAIPTSDPTTYWNAVNKVLNTAVVSAGAGAVDTVTGQPVQIAQAIGG